MNLCLGKLYLHPISETHQLRPSLTYMDILTRRSRRRAGEDEDSDEGPPPDPDEPAPLPIVKKEKKVPIGEAKEVQVSVRKAADDKGISFGGGITAVRREMLMKIRAEEDESWEDYEFHDGQVCSSLEF